MKPDRWQKIDAIFHAALQHKPDERGAFIDEACQGDEELRREVESLLAEEGEADRAGRHSIRGAAPRARR